MELFRRYGKNPIISVHELPFPALGVYNPGVAEYDGGVVLLLRVELPDGRSMIYRAYSRDGIGGWEIDTRPLLTPEDLRGTVGQCEPISCEDPRVTYVPELRRWVIAYVAVLDTGPAVALAWTEDFVRVQPMGVILSPPNKDAAVLPERINGLWYLLHRPMSGGAEHIWSAVSPDLIHWGNPQVVLRERGGLWWDGERIGIGGPPLKLPEGWLLIYHGVKGIAGTLTYRLGVALLDATNPSHVLARSPYPVMSPQEPYERLGQGVNIVFSCGALLRGEELWLYYGAADTCIGLAFVPVRELVRFLQENHRPV